MEANRKKNIEVPVPEHIAVGLLLTFVGGFLDVYTYLLHGGVFANAQTGNMVLFAMRLADKQWLAAIHCLVPICFFALGVFVSEIIEEKLHRVGRFRWRQLVVLLECALLFFIGLGLFQNHGSIVNSMVAFICAMQVSGFKKIHGVNFATTMCTGNLRSAAECFTRYLLKKDKKDGFHCLTYLLVIGIFCAGAFCGVYLVGLLAVRSIWICCAILLAVFAYLHLKNR